MKLSDFDFDLPEALIATRPAVPRSSARLLVADGAALHDCRVTNAVRCVPPKNKPTASEVNACRQFLAGEIAAMQCLEVILALGGLAHGAVVATLGHRKSAWKFGHNLRHDLPCGPVLFNSYHCSRYNTNTGRLTTAMFEDVFRAIDSHLSR